MSDVSRDDVISSLDDYIFYIGGTVRSSTINDITTSLTNIIAAIGYPDQAALYALTAKAALADKPLVLHVFELLTYSALAPCLKSHSLPYVCAKELTFPDDSANIDVKANGAIWYYDGKCEHTLPCDEFVFTRREPAVLGIDFDATFVSICNRFRNHGIIVNLPPVFDALTTRSAVVANARFAQWKRERNLPFDDAVGVVS